jgi:hypothetical protein
MAAEFRDEGGVEILRLPLSASLRMTRFEFLS